MMMRQLSFRSKPIQRLQPVVIELELAARVQTPQARREVVTNRRFEFFGIAEVFFTRCELTMASGWA